MEYTYKTDHILIFDDLEMQVYTRLIYLLKHRPPAVGFNRQPFSDKINDFVNKQYEQFNYPDNYEQIVND